MVTFIHFPLVFLIFGSMFYPPFIPFLTWQRHCLDSALLRLSTGTHRDLSSCLARAVLRKGHGGILEIRMSSWRLNVSKSLEKNIRPGRRLEVSYLGSEFWVCPAPPPTWCRQHDFQGSSSKLKNIKSIQKQFLGSMSLDQRVSEDVLLRALSLTLCDIFSTGERTPSPRLSSTKQRQPQQISRSF